MVSGWECDLGRGRRLVSLALLLGFGLVLLLGALSLGGAGAALGLAAVRRGPEGQVVTKQLHDEGAVAVRLLRQRVELGNSVVERLLGEVAGAIRRVQDLVVEDGEVKREAQANGVGRGQLRLGDVGGALERGGGPRVSSETIMTCGVAMCVSLPCRRHGQRWPRPCASLRWRTRPGSGGSRPSYCGGGHRS